MNINIGKMLLIAGGVGLLGWGASKLFAHDEAPAAADPNTTSNAGAPGATTGPTAGTPGSYQSGPYTVIPDAQSGMSLVMETATQQPVGVMDAQGNVTPVTVDANGNLAVVNEQSTADAIGTTSPGAGTSTTSTPSTTGTASATASYDQLAAQLFGNAGDPTIGSATSDAMSGTTTLGTSNATSTGAPTSYQYGNYTIVTDGSGLQLVIETATQQPVGVLDEQGAFTPVTVDASGQLQIAGGSAGSVTNAPAMVTGTTAGS